MCSSPTTLEAPSCLDLYITATVKPQAKPRRRSGVHPVSPRSVLGTSAQGLALSSGLERKEKSERRENIDKMKVLELGEMVRNYFPMAP